ncbi:MAG: ABC transporter ATP-binding protein [Planctomycetes bacterium]|nr:ABC transporter ATP-binding protein [Planctomycetota bacterium]
MAAPLVLEAQGLGKAYRLYRSPLARALEAATLGRVRGHAEHWALRDVDLALPRGAALGLCGANGAGKSTLLKLLAGTTAPSAGRYRVAGRVASLLELGSGFHKDFTGVENVEMLGVLAGHARRDVRRRLPAILEFAELGDAVHDPVRTYSTGMGLRLGFAAALGFEPEVLILDEVFAVGDAYFQKRCVDRLLELRGAGCTVLFCSHGLYDLRQLCDEALWLDSGAVRARGDVVEVTNAYAAWQRERVLSRADGAERPADWPRLTRLALRRADGAPLERARSGDDLELVVEWEDPRAARAGLHVGVTFTRQDQTLCAAAGTQLDGRPALVGARGRAVLELPRLALLSGSFDVRVHLFDAAGLFRFEERSLDAPLVVEAGTAEVGLVRLAHRWRVDATREAAA